MHKNLSVTQANLAKLPARCYTTLNTNRKLVIIIVAGESGYYRYQEYDTPEIAKLTVDLFNSQLGVTAAQISAMESGSIFGWHVPAADTDGYDAEGKPL